MEGIISEIKKLNWKNAVDEMFKSRAQMLSVG